MTLNVKVFFLLAAALLFVVALLVALDLFGSNAAAWSYAGLACFVGGHLPWRVAP